MLPFAFDDLAAATPTAKEQAGVAVTLHPLQRVGKFWEAKLELTYPEDQPQFESFESWLTENRLRLTGPTGQSVETADYDFPEQGRRTVAVYRFPAATFANPKGWTATCETPSPLVEFTVPFELKDIPLP
jgi:hypothetical protein